MACPFGDLPAIPETLGPVTVASVGLEGPKVHVVLGMR